MKINSDGSFSKATKVAGIGIVIRDSDGRVVDVFAIKVKAPDALTAEALALREAVKIAVNNGFDKVCFESNSSLLVADITNLDHIVQNWNIGVVV
ncbi:hypothetical protein COLO4_29467 [Corchorus olitorius]|uniref:RNase H type-1 domain-containing protein n=1 Tax=Corchorus olitorius TaxID=93759 RepID=A0A1R3HEG9_9ROSI|nr:hypothetical protein COLO4_29467 [Corchorus olitorius]